MYTNEKKYLGSSKIVYFKDELLIWSTKQITEKRKKTLRYSTFR